MRADRFVTISSCRNLWADLLKPAPADLLIEAEDLLILGYLRASACISRQAVRLALLEACGRCGIHPVDPVTLMPLHGQLKFSTSRIAATLVTAGKVQPEFFARVNAARNIGNRAIHGNGFDAHEPLKILTVLREVLAIEPRQAKIEPIIIPNAA